MQKYFFIKLSSKFSKKEVILITAYQLKILGVILMVLDHIGYIFPSLSISIYLRIAGRIVAPIFFYLLVEGFFYTSDRKKYSNRLLIFAILMSIGNLFLIVVFKQPNIKLINPNIFLSMFLAFKILEFLENIKYDWGSLNTIYLIMYIMLSLYSEGSTYGVFMVVIFYYFRNNKSLKLLIYVVVSIIICTAKGVVIQKAMVFAFIPIMFYNGQKGSGKLNHKYFFYWFYIIHLWVLILISIITK